MSKENTIEGSKRSPKSKAPRRSLTIDWRSFQSSYKKHTSSSTNEPTTHHARSHSRINEYQLTGLLTQPTHVKSQSKPLSKHSKKDGESHGKAKKKHRRFHARHMFQRLADAAASSALDEYPQSDGDTASGLSSGEKRRKIDRFFKEGAELTQLSGYMPISRIQASTILSNSSWDVDTAIRQLQILLSTRDGIVYSLDSEVPLRGAVNSYATTCYIDSVLMALFGAQQSYDGLLYKRDLGSKEANHLLATCRLLVNYIRAGELVSARLMEEMRSALIDCGWLSGESSSRYSQQDADELYLFLMEKLRMPYLPIEVRMVHGADKDEADDRMMTQRVIELSLPEAKEEKDNAAKESPLLLQALLEQYFLDNRVEHLERFLKSAPDNGSNDNETDKEVTKVQTNAWSFLTMYPFYTPQSELCDDETDPIADYPEDAPVILPILIKRYGVDERQRVHRIRRRVIVPMVLDVTNIVNSNDNAVVFDDDKQPSDSRARGDQNNTALPATDGVSRVRPSNPPTSTHRPRANTPGNTPPPPPYPSRVQYRLVLRSAICHKGMNASTGHYVSFSTRLRAARPNDLRSPAASSRIDHEMSTLVNSQAQKLNQLHDETPLGTGISKAKTHQAYPSAKSGDFFLHNHPYTLQSALDEADYDMHSGEMRRHSWPAYGQEYSLLSPAFSGDDARQFGSSNGSEHETTPSLASGNISGSPADWAQYAMTMNLGSLDRRLQAIPHPTESNDQGTGRAVPPPPYVPDSAKEMPDLGRVSTIGELLRFDDLDIAHDRVQYFSTAEGGLQCMNEISSDGYMLFYALQRVELLDEDGDDESDSEAEHETECQVGQCDQVAAKHSESAGTGCIAHAMEELSSALQKDEQNMSERRIIDTILNESSGNRGVASNAESNAAILSVIADYKGDGKDFEDMAMRWQNIRLSGLSSPVGPLESQKPTASADRGKVVRRGKSVGTRSGWMSQSWRETKKKPKHSSTRSRSNSTHSRDRRVPNSDQCSIM